MAKNKKLDLKEIFVPALSLFMICLVTSLAVAGVNEITKGTQSDIYETYSEIFPGATFNERENYVEAYIDGALAGYCINAQAQGYGGAIEVTVGLDSQGIIKVQVVNCEGETPGLGTKIQNEGFLSQFAGALDASAGFDAITGATYSSQGVADAVKQALQIYKEQIKGGEAR